MWHLKTKVGVFWVVPVTETGNDCILGVNDEELGFYTNLTDAVQEVAHQTTGYLSWDSILRAKAPLGIDGWLKGQPNDWSIN